MSFLGRVKIELARIIMQETGTYNQMFFRPFKTTHMTQEIQDAVNSRLEHSCARGGNGNKITGALFSGIASQIVSPSAAPQGNINIPNGWNEKRVRFVMEVHAVTEGGSTQIFYFQGFTNYVGIGMNGSVDEKMEFIVNSFTRVTRTMHHSPIGLTPVDNVTQQAQIINGQIINQNIPGQSYFSMRPGDVFCGIHGAYLNQNAPMTDYRVSITGDSKTTKRVNNVAGDYLANIVNAYNTSQQLSVFGSSENDIISAAIDNTYEETPQENPFFRLIASNRGGFSINAPTIFTFAELQRIDQTIGQRTNMLKLGNTLATASGPLGFNAHYAGRDAAWNSSTRETQVATILSNAVPALMMELMISQIWFEARNDLSGGQSLVVIKNARSLTSAPCNNMYDLFKQRLITELINDVTYGGQETIVLDMCIDLFGETMIQLSYGGSPMLTYTTPSFCDGLITPVINDSANGFYGLAQDMEVLCNGTSTTALELAMPTVNNLI